MNASFCRFLALALIAGPAIAAEPSVERVSGAADRSGLVLTLYQDGQTLVRDERTVELQPGPVRLALRDVSEQLLPETAAVAGDACLQVLSQRYAAPSLSRQRLLEAFVGKQVELRRERADSGATLQADGELLSMVDGLPVVRLQGEIEVIDNRSPWRIALPEVPAGLRPWPALLLDLQACARGPQALELLYLTRGVSWQADYVGRLSEDGSRLVLTGWASLDNRTATDFANARVRLVAGQPNRAGFLPMRAAAPARMEMKADLAPLAAGDYHLYPLANLVDLPREERVQVPLLAQREVAVRREYLLAGHALAGQSEPEPRSVAVKLLFDNVEPGLGVPLPAGTVRIYQQDPQGQPLFLGEDRIDHSPAGAKMELDVGKAFDLRGQRVQTAFRRIGDEAVEVGWRIQIFNSRKVPVTVEVEEELSGEWRILSSNLQHRQIDAGKVRWTVEVPAAGGADLEYTAQVRH